MRQQSSKNRMPWRLQIAATPSVLAMLTGCPPPLLLVTVRITAPTWPLCSFSRWSSAAMSMLPLKGCSSAVSLPSAMGMSIAVAPENSMFARVVSKCVLLMKTLPAPPRCP